MKHFIQYALLSVVIGSSALAQETNQESKRAEFRNILLVMEALILAEKVHLKVDSNANGKPIYADLSGPDRAILLEWDEKGAPHLTFDGHRLLESRVKINGKPLAKSIRPGADFQLKLTQLIEWALLDQYPEIHKKKVSKVELPTLTTRRFTLMRDEQGSIQLFLDMVYNLTGAVFDFVDFGRHEIGTDRVVPWSGGACGDTFKP